MRTVIVRLSDPTGDGLLHGIAEVVEVGSSSPFTDDATLLALLHAANGSTTPVPRPGTATDLAGSPTDDAVT